MSKKEPGQSDFPTDSQDDEALEYDGVEESAPRSFGRIGIPAFISRSVRQALYDLGYPAEAVDAMDPRLAQELLASERRYGE